MTEEGNGKTEEGNRKTEDGKEKNEEGNGGAHLRPKHPKESWKPLITVLPLDTHTDTHGRTQMRTQTHTDRQTHANA